MKEQRCVRDRLSRIFGNCTSAYDVETVAEEAKRGYAHLCNSRGGKEPAYISALVPMFRNAGVGSRPCFPNMATLLLLLLLRTYRERRTNVSLKRLLYVLTRAPPLRLEVTMAIPRANGSPLMCAALWRRYAPFRREYFTKIWKRKKKGGKEEDEEPVWKKLSFHPRQSLMMRRDSLATSRVSILVAKIPGGTLDRRK